MKLKGAVKIGNVAKHRKRKVALLTAAVVASAEALLN